MRRLLYAATALLVAAVPAPASATPFDLFVASVTCIPNTLSAQSCLSDPAATTGHWRIVNWMAPAVVEETNLFDVTLTFDYLGGSRSWHWDTVGPLTQFVETEELPIAAFLGLERLTLTGTVGRTSFPEWGGNPYVLLVLGDARVSASADRFPPPLDVFAPSEQVLLPTPEPASLALMGTGLAAVGLCRLGTRRRRR